MIIINYVDSYNVYINLIITIYEQGRKYNMSKKKESLKADIDQFKMLQDLFSKMYAEIYQMSRKKPEGIVNSFKVERINRVLKPLYVLMEDEPYISYLELVTEPTEEKQGRRTVENGLTYSDVMLILSQYRSGLEQYNKKHFSNVFDY